MTEVLAPVAGRLLPLSAVPDEVFAGEMVGSGVAIEPSVPADGAEAVVVAPVTGTVLKLHPHAAIILASDGVGVLVHIGIDTVNLNGEGFTLLAAECLASCGTAPALLLDGERHENLDTAGVDRLLEAAR